MPIIIKGILIDSGVPLVCVPVVERQTEDIIHRVAEASEAGIRCVEWRADYFVDLFDREKLRETLERLRSVTRDMVLIVTVRSAEQGGEVSVSSLEMHRLLLDISTAHAADFIDVEAFAHQDTAALINVLHNNGALVIASSHDFEGTPTCEEMADQFRRMSELDPDIVKLAVMPRDKSDVFLLMEAAAAFKKTDSIPLIAISMGEKGTISRVGAQSFGGCITFGSLDKASAPGQFDARRLSELINEIDGYI